MRPKLPEKITIREKYAPAMEITDQAEADAYFVACVEHTMAGGGVNRQEAERIERINLGYYSGYYNLEVMARVQRLFLCTHPVFGPVQETASQAV